LPLFASFPTFIHKGTKEILADPSFSMILGHLSVGCDGNPAAGFGSSMLEEQEQEINLYA